MSNLGRGAGLRRRSAVWAARFLFEDKTGIREEAATKREITGGIQMETKRKKSLFNAVMVILILIIAA